MQGILKNAGMLPDLIKHAVGSANQKRKVPRLAITEDPIHKQMLA